MAQQRWKAGILGLRRGASFGRLIARHPRCELTACYDPSPEVAARFREITGASDAVCVPDYAAFLRAPMDVVIVASPIPLHVEQTIQAMERGCHVLCEVTMAMTVEGCEAIVACARRTGKTYMMAENCNYWPFIKEWKRLVRSGRIGDVFYAECEYLHPIPELIVNPQTGAPTWRAQRPPIIYCTHSLGPVLDILDDRITRAMGLGDGHRLLPDGGIGGADLQIALFQTAKGAIIKLLRSNVMPNGGFAHHYRFHGTRGHIGTLPWGAERRGWLYVQGEDPKEGRETECPLVDPMLPADAAAGGHGTAEYELIEDFLQSLETGRKPWLDAARAWDLTVPGLVAFESSRLGGIWLDVPPAPA